MSTESTIKTMNTVLSLTWGEDITIAKTLQTGINLNPGSGDALKLSADMLGRNNKE